MADDRRSDSDKERGDPPTEGVRIIGAEEAAEALERGDVAQRRGYDEPRFGDRPTPPPPVEGPRPVLRFPLASSSDPSEIDRPSVTPVEPPSESVELPHWTEPPSGQVPRIVSQDETGGDDDDLEDWAAFSSGSPR